MFRPVMFKNIILSKPASSWSFYCVISDDDLRSMACIIELLVTVNAVTLIFISGRGYAISSSKERKPGYIYNLVKSY